MADVPLVFKYQFQFKDGRTKDFEIQLDPKTFSLIQNEDRHAGSWTNLEFQQCEHCPLNKKDSPRCPLARGMEVVAESFKDVKSYEPVVVEVITEPRSYKKSLSLQEGLHGILGLIMATSGCPHLNFLKPMARFHLPFSTYEETLVRAVAFYLLRQYLQSQRGEPADFTLKTLESWYKNVEKVNSGIIERIRSMAPGDADANSIVILDGYAKLLSMEIAGGLADIEKFFPTPDVMHKA